jgi:hypothetical protein
VSSEHLGEEGGAAIFEKVNKQTLNIISSPKEQESSLFFSFLLINLN